MRVDVLNRSGARVSGVFLTRCVRRISAFLSRAGMRFPEGYMLTVALLKRKEMQRLNRTFRGKDAPTTVLSFDYASAGDLFLAPEAIRREARMRRLPLRTGMARFAAHGLLHLAGAHHGGPRRQTQRFERLELQLLKHLEIYWE